MSTYNVTCVKARATITGSIADAIMAAREMSDNLQPAFGVSIEDARIVHSIAKAAA